MARRTGAVLLVGTILGGWAAPVLAQDVSAPTPVPVDTQPVPGQRIAFVPAPFLPPQLVDPHAESFSDSSEPPFCL